MPIARISASNFSRAVTVPLEFAALDGGTVSDWPQFGHWTDIPAPAPSITICVSQLGQLNLMFTGKIRPQIHCITAR
jgi:hypothetical protein